MKHALNLNLLINWNPKHHATTRIRYPMILQRIENDLLLFYVMIFDTIHLLIVSQTYILILEHPSILNSTNKSLFLHFFFGGELACEFDWWAQRLAHGISHFHGLLMFLRESVVEKDHWLVLGKHKKDCFNYTNNEKSS